MEISATFLAHLLTTPHSLLLPVVIIWGYLLKIFFFILACMQCLLYFRFTSQIFDWRALAELELKCINKTWSDVHASCRPLCSCLSTRKTGIDTHNFIFMCMIFTQNFVCQQDPTRLSLAIPFYIHPFGRSLKTKHQISTSDWFSQWDNSKPSC